MLKTSALALALLLCLSPLAAQGGAFLDGRWEGSVDLGSGREVMVLRLFPADAQARQPAGGLLDLPARSLFGYPIEALQRDAGGLSFSLLGGAPFEGRFELRGAPSAAEPGSAFELRGPARIVGADGRRVEAQGSFALAWAGYATRGEGLGRPYSIATGHGRLPGSLLLPDAGDPALPLVLMVSGAGADRDGNNYEVPGRSDALAQLAVELRRLGIASLRYDRRGSGEAYRLGENEEALRFDDHIADLRSAIAALSADVRFSSITLLGYGEGALVGAAAIEPDEASAQAPRFRRVSGLIALCASGRSEIDLVEEALSSPPPGLEAEAQAIQSALEEGRTYPRPSPYFADFFRPSIQPYIISQLRFDPGASLAIAPVPVLVVAGGSDLQVEVDETEILLEAKPDAAYRLIPGMSHALKGVGTDEEANYASFTDPGLPLAEGLGALVAAFARGAPLPGEDPRGQDAATPDAQQP